jgi:hypothetical protein
MKEMCHYILLKISETIAKCTQKAVGYFCIKNVENNGVGSKPFFFLFFFFVFCKNLAKGKISFFLI